MKELDIEPRFNRVILIRDDVDKKTDGGIILPDTVSNRIRTSIGTVLSVGDTADVSIRGGKDKDTGKEYPSLVGKKIMFGEYSGAWIKDGYDENLFVINDEDILGVING